MWPATCTFSSSMKRFIPLFFVLLLVAGCAGKGVSGPQIQLPVRVNNNLIPPATVTVYLVPQSGIEHNLGTLVGSGQHTLIYRGLPLSGTYMLVARADTRGMQSNPIVLDHNVSSINWDLRRNYLQITVAD